MKKIQILGFALFAVLAFSAVAAASAFAESEWLVGGAVVAAELASETTGELELTDLNTAAGAASVLCSGILLGTIGPGKVDLVTAVDNLAGVNEGNLVNCTPDKICTNNPVDVIAEKLPWDTEIVLVSGTFRDLVLGATWRVDCVVPLLGLIEDVCEGTSSALLKNGGGGVEGTFEALSEKATCSLGGAGAGDIVGSGVTTAAGGLTVS